jgi:hypothetical protein
VVGGDDFNPEHVAHARRLIEGAKLSNITVTETGFEEAAARGGENDVATMRGPNAYSSTWRHRLWGPVFP